MKNEIEKSIGFCINGIDNKSKEGEDVFVLETIRQLYVEPYRGSGLGIGDTHGDYRSTWEDYRARFDGSWHEHIQHSLTWLDALLLLFDSQNMDAEQMLGYAQKIEYAIIYNHVLKHIIENLTALDKIAEAEKYTQLFRPTHIFKPENNHDMGYRIIARYYARRCDTESFFKIFKLCEPGKERSEMELIKILLVKSVCRQQGIEVTIKLCGHKNIGDRYYYHALNVFAADGEYMKLKQLFALYPQLKQPEKETELSILAQAYLEAYEKSIPVDDDFEELFERAKNVNPKLKWGDVKLRDSILFNLGLASVNDKARLMLCRKAIKNNWVKRELPSK